MKYLLFISLIIILSGCFQPDEILPKVKDYTTEITVSTKGKQAAYIDLSSADKLANSSESPWHLKFQNTKGSWSILLNTLLGVSVHNTKNTNYDAIDTAYSIHNIPWQLDGTSGTGTQSAIGVWGDFEFSNPKSYKNVYLLSWSDGTFLYYYKLQILDAGTSTFHIRYGTLDGSFTKSKWIEKDPNFAYTYYSLLTQEIVNNVEPDRSDWNICFTYLPDSIIHHGSYPFVPTINKQVGLYQALLINDDFTEIHLDTSKTFSTIDYFYAKDLEYTDVDGLINLFQSWEENQQKLSLKDNLCLLVKEQNSYYALKVEEIRTDNPTEVTIKLRIKQL